MTLPDKVQIGPVCYTVTEDRVKYLDAVEDEHDTFYGRIKYSACEIVLDPKPTADQKRITLLHEVIHGIWGISDRSKDQDEKEASLLSMMLVDTLRRNPALVAYLTEENDAESP